MYLYDYCLTAYEGLKNLLKNTGSKYENRQARSRKKKSTVLELVGITFRVIDPSGVFDLIERIGGEADERIRYLMELGDSFIVDKWLPVGDNHYTYNDRIYPQKKQIVDNITEHRNEPNRQAFLSIWHPELDIPVLGVEEVPCSIGYHFIPRNGILNMVYFMRSLDLEIWPNDMYLSDVVLHHIAEKCDMRVGSIIFSVGCLHLFDS